jgi:hypothetical protein
LTPKSTICATAPLLFRRDTAARRRSGTVALDVLARQSRRSLLVGAITAAAGAAAATVAGARAVLAAGDDGQTIHVADTWDDIRNRTQLANNANNNNLLEVFSDGHGLALYGFSRRGYGIEGTSFAANRAGVLGVSNAGTGVYGAASVNDPNVSAGVDATPVTGVYGYSDMAAGAGVRGQATDLHSVNFGVYGRSSSSAGTGVYGYADSASGSTCGVYGQSSSSAGTGVYGHADSATGLTFGVWGQSQSHKGVGVVGYAQAYSGPTRGVYGQVNSPTGQGAVVGYASAASGATPGVLGIVGSPAGAAVKGAGGPGRGGLFSGRAAQLRLAPASTTSHPASGLPGDLFLDKSHRLWFCKGGVTWVKLA